MTISPEARKAQRTIRLIIGTMTLSTMLVSVVLVSPACAQSAAEHASHVQESAHETGSAKPSVSPDVQAATDAVDRLGAALKKGDMAILKSLLDPDVLILESGSAERNRNEYLGHHAVSDAAFLSAAHVELLHRTARRSGDLVWVGSESEIHTRKEDKPLTLLSTETVVLKKVGEDWRIVHIHWSSRPKS